MRKLLVWFAIIATMAGLGLVVPSSASAAPYCGITWGSLDKSDPAMSTSPVANVRAGRHDCFDRVVVDLTGGASGFRIGYVSAVYMDGSGQLVPLRGGAFLNVVVLAPAYDSAGKPTYGPAHRGELVNVGGYDTFRQIAYAGSFEGQTTIGLGVRARLPYRVFTLAGPGIGSRVVLDVAHRW